MMKAANKMVRPIKKPRPIPVKQPRPIPVKQPRPIPAKQPRPNIQLGIGPGGQPLPSPGMQQPANSFGGLAEGFLRQQPGMAPQPASSALNDLMKRFGDQPRGPTALPGPAVDPRGPTAFPGAYGMQPGGFNPTPDIKYGVQPLPAAPGPLGGQLTQSAPMQQQAAPAQPVPAMKKGGMVRGQGAAIRGTKFKGIF
jgi:hypothetical protein